MPAGSVCPPVCHTPVPAICGDGEISCDGGSTNGCPNLNTCHPAGLTIFNQLILPSLFTVFIEGTVCPHVCHTPAPAICGDGEMSCDGGSNNGCPNVNTCHPEGFQNVLFVKVYSDDCYFI